MKFFAVFIFFWTTFLWSFETLEDSKTRFVFKDKVLDSELAACEDGSYRLLPENGVYKSSSSMPYRAYRIAVPANEKPSVSIRDSIRFRFPEKWCAALPSFPPATTIVLRLFSAIISINCAREDRPL